MSLIRTGGWLSENFDALCECDKHTPQYGTLSKSFVNSALATVSVVLLDDATLASVTAAIFTPFLLYDCQRGVFLEDPNKSNRL